MPLRRRQFLGLSCLSLLPPAALATTANTLPATAGSATDTPALPLIWPDTEWARIAPEQAGWSQDLLAQAQAYSRSAGSAAVMVIQHGLVIDSWGDIDKRRELYSVRKSLLSALIGIEVDKGTIHLDATLASLGIDDVAPSLSDTEKQATVRQLLQARSGVYHRSLYETAGEQRLRPERGAHAPGTFWYYNNWDFNTLGTIYERAAGMSIFDAFAQRIATPIGMQDYRPSDGRYVHGADSRFPAYPIHMTARDMARFGLLYLRGGRWGDRQVVPGTWVTQSTTGYSETRQHAGYGYLWWTGWPDRCVAVMDLSPGGFWADGNHGQFIVVDPVNDLVVVHQTAGRNRVTQTRMGHLMWLLLRAAGAADPGQDPLVRPRNP